MRAVHRHLQIIERRTIAAVVEHAGRRYHRQRTRVVGVQCRQPEPRQILAHHQGGERQAARELRRLEEVIPLEAAAEVRAGHVERKRGGGEGLRREIEVERRRREIPAHRPRIAGERCRAVERERGNLVHPRVEIAAHVEVDLRARVLPGHAPIGIEADGDRHQRLLCDGTDVDLKILEHVLVVAHAGMRERHARDALERPRPGAGAGSGAGTDTGTGTGAGAGPGARAAGRSRPAQTLPVAFAIRVLDETRVEPIDGDASDLEPLRKERQHARPKRGVLERQERCLAEPRRIAEARRPHLERDPREHRQLDVALQHKISAGRRLDRCDEVRLIAVGVDEQPHRQQRESGERGDAAHDGAENLGRIPIARSQEFLHAE